MRISKFVQSCLLVEEQGMHILMDPGNYSFDAKVLDVNKLPKLDYLLITHEHTDHFYLPFIKEIVQKFPDVTIISNPSVVGLLDKESISATFEGNEFIKLEVTAHEKHWDKEPPQNVMFELFGKLVHPGDSLGFVTEREIVALPFVGPSWMIAQAVEKALAIRPKVIIPIHEWSWSDAARQEYYKRLGDFFNQRGIEFKAIETGQVIEV